MKFLSLELNNFRQFAGYNKIDFGANNKVTIIYGLNGYGKTGIFRAIMFCLYGDRSLTRDRLEGTDESKGLLLVNQSLLDEAQGGYVEASVKLNFEHNDVRYELERKISAKSLGDDFIQENGEVTLTQVVNNNTKEPITDYDVIKVEIARVIDKSNRDFFLFDGEQLEELTLQNSGSMKEIRRGITTILKLDAIDTVKKALGKAERQVETEIRNHSLSTELEQISDNISNNIKERTEAEELLSEYQQQLKVLGKEHEEVEEWLRKCADSVKLQNQKDEYVKSIGIIDSEIEAKKDDIKESFRTIGAFLGDSVLAEAFDELNKRVDRGELPANIKDDFIKELISRGKCICGTNLNSNNEAADSLRKFLDNNLGDISEGGFKVFKLVQNLNSKVNYQINKNIEDIIISYDAKINEKDSINKQIQSIDTELEGNVATKDYAEKAKRIKDEIKEYEKKAAITENKIKELLSEHARFSEKREKLSSHNNKVAKFIKQQTLLKESSRALSEIYSSYSDELRIKLSEAATDLMHKIADKASLQSMAKIVISDKFALDVLSPTGTKILSQISSGQRQVVSISYICSLMQVSIGLTMPLLMDTPFGRLSGAPRDAFLKELPKLLSQWILLTTDTEFTLDEARALRESGSWGKIYVINSENGKSRIEEKDVNTWQPKRSSN